MLCLVRNKGYYSGMQGSSPAESYRFFLLNQRALFFFISCARVVRRMMLLVFFIFHLVLRYAQMIQ